MRFTSVRLHHLDSLRAFLMLVGIPYHAALAYSTTPWLVSSASGGFGFTLLASFIHEWRMPAFFVIAGFFAALISRRRGRRSWLRDRSRRLGIPLAFGVVAINLPLTLVLVSIAPRVSADQGSVLADATPAVVLGHLWFLAELLAFCVAFAAVPRSRRLRAWIVGALERWPVARNPGLLGGGVVIALVIATMAGAATARALALDPLFSDAPRWAVYFMAGVLLGASRRLFSFLLSAPGKPMLVLGGAVVLAAAWMDSQALADGSAVQLARIVLRQVAGVVAIRLLMGLAAKHLHAERGWVRGLTDDSLVIYLVHQPFIVLVDLVLLPLSLPSPVSFALALIGGLGGGLLCAAVARRFALARLLTTGRTQPSRRILQPQG